MGLSIPGVWIWDFWHALDGDVHHLFFLRSPQSQDPEDRHWNVRIGHARSDDLRSWTVLADALAPAERGSWDDLTTWTGSVLRHDDRWWMFYTGTSHRERGLVQRVGLAVSDDLTTWHRHGTEPLIEADPRWYELLDLASWPEQAWRDPWVFRADDGTFHCLVTARAGSGDPATRGVIGHAVSQDLLSWEVRPPVTGPGPFGHLEIPQVVQLGGHWWLLFSSPASSHGHAPATAGVGGTHVLRGDAGPTGPFAWSTHQLLDGDEVGSWYGGRVVEDSSGRPYLLTWRLHDETGAFVGAVGDPLALSVEGVGSSQRRDRGDGSPAGPGQSALTAVSTLPRVSLASPNSSVVWGSKSSSFSMPAKPGRIDRLRKTTALAWSALRIGMP